MAAAAPALEPDPEIWTAASQGTLAEVRRLLDEGADIEARGGPWAMKPLHAAASNAHAAVVILLLKRGAIQEDIAFPEWDPQVISMLVAEVVVRIRREAFAMGQHKRLGADSRVQQLDAGVVQMVMEQMEAGVVEIPGPDVLQGATLEDALREFQSKVNVCEDWFLRWTLSSMIFYFPGSRTEIIRQWDLRMGWRKWQNQATLTINRVSAIYGAVGGALLCVLGPLLWIMVRPCPS